MKKLFALSAASVLFTVAVVALPAESQALSCAQQDDSKFIQDGGVIFIGTADSVVDLGRVVNEYGVEQIVLQVTFSAQRAWSTNQIPRSIKVKQFVPIITGDDFWGQAKRFESGQTYIVRTSTQNGEFRASAGACGGSYVFSNTTEANRNFTDQMIAQGLGSGYVPSATPPTPFAASPTSGAAPLTVRFTGLQQGIESIDFGDGTKGGWQDGVPAYMDHTYASPGVYTATGFGNTDGRTSITITVTNTAAYPATIIATPSAGTAPLNVTFGIYKGSSAATHLDFGDGSSVPLRSLPLNGCVGSVSCPDHNASHTYTNAGTYTARLMKDSSILSFVTVTVYGSTVTPPPPPPTTGSCPIISRTLARGSTGVDVTTLQRYFISLGVLGSSSATGYFGPLTEGAVQEWQAERGIVSAGSPSTTGWGVVGPRTRAALARCGN